MVKSSIASLGRESWRPLQAGDIVDIVAPGFASPPREIELAKKALSKWGLVPRVTGDIFGKDLLCSNSDACRFKDLKRALLAKDSAAIWCLRGGYGAIRLLPDLKKTRQPLHKKVLLGYSDVSTLHHFLNDFWQWPTLHAPMLDRLGLGKVTPSDEKLLKGILFGEIQSVRLSRLRPIYLPKKIWKKVSGKMAGGNLATVASSMGSPFQATAKGRIVCFEEIGERGHQIDRMLTQLTYSGYFKGAKAIVFGEFIGGVEPSSGRPKWRAVIERFAREQKVPVFSGALVGHGIRQMTLPFFTKSKLDLVDGRGELTVSAGSLKEKKR